MATGNAVLRVKFPNAKAVIQRLRAELARLKRATRRGT